jgi:hypothetical protein
MDKEKEYHVRKGQERKIMDTSLKRSSTTWQETLSTVRSFPALHLAYQADLPSYQDVALFRTTRFRVL